jgi:hypothetical protein
MTLYRKRIDSISLGAAGVLFVGLGLWTLLGGSSTAALPQLPEPGAAGRHQPAALA